MFVSPVQSALTPGQSTHRLFYVLIIGLPQGRDKEERRDEQTHQLGNQLSDSPYYADSPKRHIIVVLKDQMNTLPGSLQDSDYNDGSAIVLNSVT